MHNKNIKLDVKSIIHDLGYGIVQFEYIDYYLSNTINQKKIDIYYDLMQIFLFRLLILRDKYKPVRIAINDIQELSKLSLNCFECIITTQFEIYEKYKYFFNIKELEEGKTSFSSDFMKYVDNEKLMNKIFKIFVPIEILYFENPNINKEQMVLFYQNTYKKIEQCVNNSRLLLDHLETELVNIINNMPLELRVYISQILTLDYKELIFKICNKLPKNTQITRISDTNIYYS